MNENNAAITEQVEAEAQAQERKNWLTRLWEFLTRFRQTVIEDIVKILHGDQAAQLAIEALKAQASENNLEAMNVMDKIITYVANVDENYVPGQGFPPEKVANVKTAVKNAMTDYHQYLFNGVAIKECAEFFENGKLKDNLGIIQGEPDNSGYRPYFFVELNAGKYDGGAAYKMCTGNLRANPDGTLEHQSSIKFVPLKVGQDEMGTFKFDDKDGAPVYTGTVTPVKALKDPMKTDDKTENLKHQLLYYGIVNDAKHGAIDVYNEEMNKRQNDAKIQANKFKDLKATIEDNGKRTDIKAELKHRKDGETTRLELTGEDGFHLTLKQREDGKIVAYEAGVKDDNDEPLNYVEFKDGQIASSYLRGKEDAVIKLLSCPAAQEYMAQFGYKPDYINCLKFEPSVSRVNNPKAPFTFTGVGEHRFEDSYCRELTVDRLNREIEGDSVKNVIANDNGVIAITLNSGKKMAIEFNKYGNPTNFAFADNEKSGFNCYIEPNRTKSNEPNNTKINVEKQQFNNSNNNPGKTYFPKEFIGVVKLINAVNRGLLNKDQKLENTRSKMADAFGKRYSFLPEETIKSVVALAMHANDDFCQKVFDGKAMRGSADKTIKEERFTTIRGRLDMLGSQPNVFDSEFTKSGTSDAVVKATNAYYLATHATAIEKALDKISDSKSTTGRDVKEVISEAIRTNAFDQFCCYKGNAGNRFIEDLFTMKQDDALTLLNPNKNRENELANAFVTFRNAYDDIVKQEAKQGKNNKTSEQTAFAPVENNNQSTQQDVELSGKNGQEKTNNETELRQIKVLDINKPSNREQVIQLNDFPPMDNYHGRINAFCDALRKDTENIASVDVIGFYATVKTRTGEQLSLSFGTDGVPNEVSVTHNNIYYSSYITQNTPITIPNSISEQLYNSISTVDGLIKQIVDENIPSYITTGINNGNGCRFSNGKAFDNYCKFFSSLDHKGENICSIRQEPEGSLILTAKDNDEIKISFAADGIPDSIKYNRHNLVLNKLTSKLDLSGSEKSEAKNQKNIDKRLAKFDLPEEFRDTVDNLIETRVQIEKQNKEQAKSRGNKSQDKRGERGEH